MKAKIVLVVLSILTTVSGWAQDNIVRKDSLRASVIVDEKSFVRETGTVRLNKDAIIGVPVILGTSDLLRSISNLSGVSAGMELLSGLYVHGGDSGENLYLIDGVPLYQLSHMAGLYSSFNPEVISSIDFYKSGFPCRYGGRLSSVVDTNTNEGYNESHHGSISMGLIDGRIQLGGPIIKGKLKYDIGLRSSWMDAIVLPSIAIMNKNSKNKTEARYLMADFNLGFIYTPSYGDKISFRFFSGGDVVAYGDSEIKKIYTDKTIYQVNDINKFNADWGNLASSIEWRHSISDQLTTLSRVYYTRGFSDFSFELTDNEPVADSIMVTKLHEDNSNMISTLGVLGRIDARIGNHAIESGIEYRYYYYSMARNYASIAAKTYHPNEVSLYAEDVITMGPAILRGGIRCDYYSLLGNEYFIPQPRVSLSSRMGPGIIVKASYTVMSQTQHLLSPILADIPTNSWVPSVGPIKPEYSQQYALGANWKPFKGRGLRFDMELYYKTLQNSLLYTGTTTVFAPVENWETYFSQGEGRSVGVELECEYVNRSIRATVNYTLSKTEKKFNTLYPYWFPDRFDNRHKLTINTIIQLYDGINLIALWNYHSGNRVTAPTYYAVDSEGDISFLSPSPYNYQLPAYHRLDVGCDFHHRTKRGNDSVWNISICNVYNRRNPIMVMPSYSDDGNVIIKAWSMIPILPSFGYRLEF